METIQTPFNAVKNNTHVRFVSAAIMLIITMTVFMLGTVAIKTFLSFVTGVMVYELFAIKNVSRSSILIKIIFLIYMLCCIGCMLLLWQKNGLTFLLWMILSVSANDTAAFFVGRFLMGPKLASRISPNKTLSGFIGGIIIGTAISYLSQPYFLTTIFSPTFCLLVSLSSHMGDLLESAFKRALQIKDTSSLIPGHGGVIDRLDSLFAVSLFIYSALLLWS